MEIVKTLKDFLDGYFYVDDRGLGIIKVLPLENNIVNPEIYLEIQDINKGFEVNKVVRGNKVILGVFTKKENAILCIALQCMKWKEDQIYPQPEVDIDLYEVKDTELEIADRCISKQIEKKFYNINQIKKESICLLKKNNIYKIFYVDADEKLFLINGDNDELGIGMVVLYNYAWLYQWMYQLIEKWRKEVNINNNEMGKIIKILLDVQG
ncbi:TPA: hypothetical protein PTV43_001602 [Clostridium botulinum]|nr:hypothetical protein [Clostridium botulinum]